MIRVRLQIGYGEILETADNFGLIYVSSDNIFQAPIKEFERTSYPEEEGEHIIDKSAFDAFDYKVSWFVKADGSLGNANSVISRFNQLISAKVGDSLWVWREVAFYNDYKKVKIVGTPSPIKEATEFWRDANGKQHDVVKVDWVIRVSKPSLCDFNLT